MSRVIGVKKETKLKHWSDSEINLNRVRVQKITKSMCLLCYIPFSFLSFFFIWNLAPVYGTLSNRCDLIIVTFVIIPLPIVIFFSSCPFWLPMSTERFFVISVIKSEILHSSVLVKRDDNTSLRHPSSTTKTCVCVTFRCFVFFCIRLFDT